MAGQPGWDLFFPGSTAGPAADAGEHLQRTSAVSSGRPASPTAGQGAASACTICGHAFAVSNLRSWFASGEDIDALLPAVLQAYIGHSSISDTACYLKLTAESCPQIAARVQHEFGDIVPPVTAEACHGD